MVIWEQKSLKNLPDKNIFIHYDALYNIYKELKRTKYISNYIISSQFIKRFGNFGMIHIPCKVFNEHTKNRNRNSIIADITIYSGMISTLSKTQNGNAALKLYKTIKNQYKLNWTEILSNTQLSTEIATLYTSVLNSCSHSGLNIEAEHIYNEYVSNVNDMDHRKAIQSTYIDVLSRIGSLKEAYTHIQ